MPYEIVSNDDFAYVQTSGEIDCAELLAMLEELHPTGNEPVDARPVLIDLSSTHLEIDLVGSRTVGDALFRLYHVLGRMSVILVASPDGRFIIDVAVMTAKNLGALIYVCENLKEAVTRAFLHLDTSKHSTVSRLFGCPNIPTTR